MGKANVTGNLSPELPAGIIVDWYGAANAVPIGWALCDGQNGTPNLRDKFVVSAGGAYALGAQGGEAVHTLTVNEMPRHNHTINDIFRKYGGSLYPLSTGGTGGVGSYGKETVALEGGGQSHNNLPPYFALFKIMKL